MLVVVRVSLLVVAWGVAKDVVLEFATVAVWVMLLAHSLASLLVVLKALLSLAPLSVFAWGAHLVRARVSMRKVIEKETSKVDNWATLKDNVLAHHLE